MTDGMPQSLVRAVRIPRTAWPMRCSFSTSAKRTWPSPVDPKPTPGLTATFASRKRWIVKSIEFISSYGPGISAHTNIVPRGLSTFQPGPVEPVDEDVAAFLVDAVDVMDIVVSLIERDDRRNLNRLECPVVEIRLEFGERCDHLRIAHHKADPPPGHGMALGQRVQLDPDLGRSRDLEQARRSVPVKMDVRVGEVVDEEHLVLPSKIHETLKEPEVDAGGRRVVRE